MQHHKKDISLQSANRGVRKPALKLCLAIFSSIIFATVNFSAMVHHGGHTSINPDKKIPVQATKLPEPGVPEGSTSLKRDGGQCREESGSIAGAASMSSVDHSVSN
jgi:hypothetical protein